MSMVEAFFESACEHVAAIRLGLALVEKRRLRERPHLDPREVRGGLCSKIKELLLGTQPTSGLTHNMGIEAGDPIAELRTLIIDTAESLVRSGAPLPQAVAVQDEEQQLSFVREALAQAIHEVLLAEDIDGSEGGRGETPLLPEVYAHVMRYVPRWMRGIAPPTVGFGI